MVGKYKKLEDKKIRERCRIVSGNGWAQNQSKFVGENIIKNHLFSGSNNYPLHNL